MGKGLSGVVTLLTIPFLLYSCFISDLRVLYGTFLGPITLLIIFNVVIFVLASRVLISVNANKRKFIQGSERKLFKTTIKTIMGLTWVMVLFGLTWLFGALTIDRASKPFQYLFVICNAFQGFFFFVFICIISEDGRELWKDVITLGRLKNKSQKTTKLSTSQIVAARNPATLPGGQTLSTGVQSSEPNYFQQHLGSCTDSSTGPDFLDLQEGQNGGGLIEMSTIIANNSALWPKCPVCEAEAAALTMRPDTIEEEEEEEESDVADGRVMEMGTMGDNDSQLEFVVLVETPNMPAAYTPLRNIEGLQLGDTEADSRDNEIALHKLRNGPCSTKVNLKETMPTSEIAVSSGDEDSCDA